MPFECLSVWPGDSVIQTKMYSRLSVSPIHSAQWKLTLLQYISQVTRNWPILLYSLTSSQIKLDHDQWLNNEPSDLDQIGSWWGLRTFQSSFIVYLTRTYDRVYDRLSYLSQVSVMALLNKSRFDNLVTLFQRGSLYITGRKYTLTYFSFNMYMYMAIHLNDSFPLPSVISSKIVSSRDLLYLFTPRAETLFLYLALHVSGVVRQCWR